MLGLVVVFWIAGALLIIERCIATGEPPWMVFVALLWPLAVLWAALVVWVIKPAARRRMRRADQRREGLDV